MVAQDMAQSYDQLFRTSGQELQEFISLEELGNHRVLHHHHNQHNDNTNNHSHHHHHHHHNQAQRSRDSHHHHHHHHHHPWVSTSSTSSHLYPASTTRDNSNADDNGDDDTDVASGSEQRIKQQRTYYNLSTARHHDSCGPVFSGEIANKIPEIGVDESAKFSLLEKEVTGSSVVCVNRRNEDSSGNDNDGDSNSRSNAQSTKMILEKIDNESPNGDYRRSRRRNNHHNQQQRNDNQYQIDDSTSVDETASEQQDDFSPIMATARKRKISFQDDNDLADQTGDGKKSNKANTDSKKQNHSEIEKRRRDKMNTYITELSAMVPMCHAMSRKLDKLTVLRMAVQHLKTILGAVTSYTEVHYKPTFISDQELKTLILQAAEGFVFVVGCDRGRILYVSQSVAQTLNYSQDDLLGQSWFDILHPKDVAKVKEQLSSSDLSPRERLIDAKTMLPVKTDIPQGVSRLCPGARRSFFCRMKRKLEASGSGSTISGGGGGGSGESQVKEEADTTTGCHRRKKQQSVDWKYCVVHCTGYLKSWAPAKIGLEEHEGDGDGEDCSLSCLVAVGRIQPAGLPLLSSGPTIPRLRTIEFISRHAIDGKFLFVDQRATLALGYLPQELLGTSMYEYYHHDDIPHLADSHKTALQSSDSVITRIYRFRAKGSSFVKLQSGWKSFRNPWTKDIEYLISKNSAVYCGTRHVESSVNRSEGSSVKDNYDYFAQSNGGLERLISSHVEMSKIGRRIAEQVLDNQRRNEDSCSVSSPNSIAPERSSLNADFQIRPNVSPEGARDVSQPACADGGENRTDQTSPYNQQINNSIANDRGGQPDDMLEIISGTAMNESPNPLPSDGNDEAAMAVIMSLLEADAGLGGPVDFSGLPWPLP